MIMMSNGALCKVTRLVNLDLPILCIFLCFIICHMVCGICAINTIKALTKLN